MALEYCIYCGYPLKGNVFCPGCEKEVKELLPFEQLELQRIPENIISQLEKSKVSFFQNSSKKRAVAGMRNGSVLYTRVTISASYEGKRSEDESDVQYVSIVDSNGNPLSHDFGLKKGGQIQRDLQREYSAHLKNTEAIVVKFDSTTYYVFAAKFEDNLGEYMASGWGDIWSVGHKKKLRKVHNPRHELDDKDPNKEVKLKELYEYRGNDPLNKFIHDKALDAVDFVIDKLPDAPDESKKNE